MPITLVTGGARSGKSRFALELALAGERPAFIATAEPFDGEMAERISRHREERGERCLTVEEPLDLAAALARLPPDTGIAVVDCLTVWLGNLLHREERQGSPNGEEPAEIAAFLAALASPPCPLVLVTNEVGMGLVADHPLGRRFVDLSGRLNQAVAGRAERVVLLVSGLPLHLKGGAG
ncbi:MAG TPA: bifunctional adenosylcobinamide kinase/adenosylcobinamide-phosphate guanylyltransferase [Thermoanaerobaculia bacterium]|nr:bifunctional adenosylcobinamide kinase/adenosylcobinamide-phosphate guanylyltransferase [Thermoanaerobaculia bacterium]